MKQGKIFEPEIVEIAKKYIVKNSTVLDVGANLGQMSLLFSDFTGSEGQVFAFEADSFIFSLRKVIIFYRQFYAELTQLFVKYSHGEVYEGGSLKIHYFVGYFFLSFILFLFLLSF
jgi:tRNA A58 N-methylase Trm61